MTDALTDLVRVGLRNPVRIVVKVESKQKTAAAAGTKRKAQDTDNASSTVQRRTPARSASTVLKADYSNWLLKH